MSETKDYVGTALFLINEAEVEIGKLTTPNLTHRAKQHIADTALGHLRAAKAELGLVLNPPVEEVPEPEQEDDDNLIVLDEELTPGGKTKKR